MSDDSDDQATPVRAVLVTLGAVAWVVTVALIVARGLDT